MNRRYVEFYERPPAEWIGRHMMDIIGPEAYAHRQRYLAQAANGETVTFDATMPHPDGGVREASIRYIPRMGAEGYEGFYAFVFGMPNYNRDLASLLDRTDDSIIVRNMDDTISYWSSGCAQLYGWPRDEALGKNLHALTDAYFSKPLEEIQVQLLERGSWTGDITRAARDGGQVIVAARWTLRRDALGQPLEILEASRDVTEQHRRAAELRKSEYRYRNMFRAMAASFWELDFTEVGKMMAALWKEGITPEDFPAYLETHPEFVREAMRRTRVIDVNDKTVEMYGARTKEDLLIDVSPFWPAKSEHIYAGSLIAAVQRKPQFVAQTQFHTLDGREIDAIFTCCFPAEAMGRGNILVGVVDITERTRAENELLRVQAELAHAARVATLGELSASIAHELNQPLAAIITNGEAGLRWLNRPAPDTAEAKSALSRMIQDGQRASAIIGRVRAMATKAPPRHLPLAINDLIGDAALLVQREVAAQGIDFRQDFAIDLPDLEGDRVQLQQVVVNLLINAIQAMLQEAAPPYRLLLRSRRAPNGELLVSVVDSGPGVAEADHGHLFTAFYTTKPTGMGMGLSICRSIVEAHGGRIWCEPAEPRGTAFHFTLPVAPA